MPFDALPEPRWTHRFRGLAWFWGCVLGTAAGGVATLQALGPPTPTVLAVAAPAIASPTLEAAPAVAASLVPSPPIQDQAALPSSEGATVPAGGAVPPGDAAPEPEAHETEAAPIEPAPSVSASLVSPPGTQQPAVIQPPVPAPVPQPQMVGLPGGTFRMGSMDDLSERPLHAVTLPPFRIAAHAVTVAEWQLCVQQDGCAFKPDGRPDDPVANVSWDDARQYLAWLSKAAQTPYRLPTEAEWEYAARAGSQARYAWGDEMLLGKASCRGCGPSTLQSRPAVGDYPPNRFGLYAMGGGVAEWTADCWHRDYTAAPRDGSAPWDAPGCRERVLRGGSWMSKPGELRAASREFYDASVRYPTHGFRVVQSK